MTLEEGTTLIFQVSQDTEFFRLVEFNSEDGPVQVFQDTELSESVEIYTEDGLEKAVCCQFGDSGEGTVHIHCSDLPGQSSSSQ